jgi:CRISPR-associated exonuclease Cas4
VTFSEDDLLPLSALTDVVFCERRLALHQIERVWQENVATTEGHHLHDKVHEPDSESRGDVRIARGVRLRSLRLGLTGIADVVEFHRPENGAQSMPWRPFPVEYKRGVLRQELSFEVQLCAQALCLEEMLNVAVPCGAMFYGLSRRRFDVVFDSGLRARTEQATQRAHELVAAGVTPPPVYDERCEKCSLKESCLPKTTGGGRSVQRYMAQYLKESPP